MERVGDVGLGDEGGIFEGSPPLSGAPTVVHMWRTGSYLLSVFAVGSVEADADEIRTIAEGMQVRADGSR